ncbi:SbcC/MukB-like Walker B domain-containing protein [Fictibacillus fluitans]|uniref:Nuclease SbcCD subunit C n=1 Tax=Fictibacillus fluitans TaxID=3058422 RepID=A0ABT8HSI4_9BACL|nr:SMC family ATPase [Fictibacillus sp. NE201]MDN4523735.1 SMC family ATPase [Fictibacillus sp. NE201]
MRPVGLQVAGLQSFREKQTIEFDQLCGGGVFGIFGPTGSGKSSILDAITLALYGKVERAAGGTQGIMNHAENALSVAFTFELGAEDGLSRYKIERNYKRSGDHTIRTSTCRLLFMKNGEWTVQADKEREVTQQVQELLGLTIEDFTRAVVLPQGKFAEFLSLKGAERRQMLQRLFQLEKYGDQLNQKLKKRVEKSKTAMEHLAAEQAGLGDASKEALDEAERAWKEAREKAERKRSHAEEEEQKYEKNKQVWQAQEYLKEVEEEEKRLQQNAGHIQVLEQNLERARLADLLKPYGEEAEKAQKEEEACTKKEQELRQEAEEAKGISDHAQETYEAAKKEKEEHEPSLISKREQLLSAIEMEKEAETKEQAAGEKEQQLNGQLQKLEVVVSKQKDAERLLHRAVDRQNELQRQLKETIVSSTERDRINRAQEAALNMEYEAKQAAEAQKEVHQANLLHQTTMDEHNRFKDRKETLETKIHQSSSKVLAVFHEVSELGYVQEQLSYHAGQFEEQLTERREKDQVRELASRLSQQLAAGKPCAVCGSTEHPDPIGHYEPDHEAVQQISKVREVQKQAGFLEKEIYMMKSTLERLSENLQHYMEEPEAAASSLSSHSPPTLPQSIRELEEWMTQTVNKVKELRQDVLETDEAVKKIGTEYRELSSIEATVKAQLSTAEKEARERRQRLEKAEKTVGALQNEWQKEFSELPIDQVNKEKERIRTLDAQREKIEEGLVKSVPFIEEKEKIIETCRQQSAAIEKNMAILESELASLREDGRALRVKVKRIAGDETCKSLLAATESRLTQLTEQVKQLETKRQQAINAYHLLDKDWRSAQDAKERSSQRKKEALALWEEKRSSSPFADMQDLRKSLANRVEQQGWQTKIEKHFDGCKRNASEKEKLLGQLNGRTLTEEQWNNLSSVLKAVKEELHHAVQQLGETGQYHKTLETKHERYQMLEKERKKAEDQLKTLGKLQAVFRGNSFVEYVAEEQLIQVSRDASNRLRQLTRGRYAIEVDSSNGFVIRDDANGGVKRPVSTLSGGETFLTSLALALSLSSQIQLRGKYPLEFFFLDEGFGTLDQELLDTVVTALEKLHMNAMSVGIISHVPELKARLTKKLIVTPANGEGNGSRVAIEQT